jgi:NitT/TauT family transport system ATP-binding protein
MLKFNKVNFSYDNQKVLEQFDLKLFDRKINCIIGPSAVGKSTLLNLIAGTIEPQLGIINNSYHEVSYLFQEERLIDEITVYKNLDLILKSVYIDPLKRKYLITNGLKDVGLENTIDLFPNQLSGSMKRRLALLRSFLYPSKLLLVDEPFTGLDINVKRNIINLFLRL